MFAHRILIRYELFLFLFLFFLFERFGYFVRFPNIYTRIEASRQLMSKSRGRILSNKRSPVIEIDANEPFIRENTANNRRNLAKITSLITASFAFPPLTSELFKINLVCLKLGWTNTTIDLLSRNLRNNFENYRSVLRSLASSRFLEEKDWERRNRIFLKFV